MKRSTLWIGCTVQLLLTLASAHAQTGSPAKGQVIFESRCVACHSLDANRVGPALGTVVGRVAGKAPDYFYSQALGAATHVWNRDKLLAWLAQQTDAARAMTQDLK